MKKEKTIKAYKAFNPDFTCRGFQYKVGEEYTHDGEVNACQSGFHACQNPFDVLDYYPLVTENGEITRFAEVEQSGTIDVDNNKTCSSKIKVNAELNLAGFIKAGIEWIKEFTNPDKIKKNDSGDYAQIGSSGDSAKIGSSGDSAKIGSSGDYAKIGSSGYSAKIGSSGDSAQIGSSGYYAQIGSSGYYAKIGSSGDFAQIGSSGDYAQIGSSGDYAQINSSGEDSVICCAGHNSTAKAKVGSWITLAEWIYNEDKKRYVPKCVKTEYVDGERIKADTWYKLINGEFVEQKRGF